MSKYSRSNIATLCLFVCLAVAVANELSSARKQMQSKFVKEGKASSEVKPVYEFLNKTKAWMKRTDGNGFYENPYDVAECSSGEVNVSISGIQGAICSPPCPDMSCPSDPSIAARPQCALQASSGEKYCALICSPESSDNQCGDDASCKALVGIGICTYDNA